ACASNAPFSEWGQTFSDPRLAAAVVDRITFNALIIETGTDSYRLRSSRGARSTGSRRPSTKSTTTKEEAERHGH
ncbi:MAG: ATP-binding protein, partial [Acidimicrobiales bacterium]